MSHAALTLTSDSTAAGGGNLAPNYAAQRSAFAKKIGLGRTAGGKGRRGRPKK